MSKKYTDEELNLAFRLGTRDLLNRASFYYILFFALGLLMGMAIILTIVQAV